MFPSLAVAHGVGAPYIGFWGGFDPATAACQLHLGHAARACTRRALAARSRCPMAALQGVTCDPTADADAISRAIADADAAIPLMCTDGEAQTLRFLTLHEAQSDAERACNEESVAAAALLFAPVLRGVSLDSAAQSCTQRAAALGRAWLDMNLRLQQHMLDAAAATALPPSAKLAFLNRLTARMDGARQRTLSMLAAACPQFSDLYPWDPATFLLQLTFRADCILGAAYVQSAVICPPPVCGNGVPEGLEQCDDGNTADGDGCDHHCQLEH